MKKIAIEPLGESALVTTGTPLLAALLAKDLRVLMSCGGKGICSTCHVRVSSGMEQLSPMGAKERRTLSLVADVTPESRLACQTTVYGDGVTVRVPDGMYIEKPDDLVSLLGTLARENILHPVNGAILIPKGKIITRTLLEQSRRLQDELRKLREDAVAEAAQSDSRQFASFTASGVSTRPSGTTKVISRSFAETKPDTRPIPPTAPTPTTSTKREEPRAAEPPQSTSSADLPDTSRTNVMPAPKVPERTQAGGNPTGRIPSLVTKPATAPASRTLAAVHPGAQVDKYLLLERVGKGGSGVVYRALHTKLKTLVAIKFLHLEANSSDGSALERFAREAQLLAQLPHPNVVRVLDFEDHPTRPYLVMEFVEGFTAADLIAQSGRVSATRALEIGMDVAAGLEAAWTIGMIHRDVKPGNILVTRNTGSKLVDFGLGTFSCLDLSGASSSEPPGSAEGTIGYMSPEAIGRAQVDHRSDIYSLGATLFHLAAGRLPFVGQSLYELIFKHLEEAPPVLHELVPEAPPRFSAVIQKMMAKTPAARYQEYSDLREDLARLLGDCQKVTGSTSPTQFSLFHGQTPDRTPAG